MFVTTFDTKDKKDKVIYIKHSYSIRGVKKQIILEKYKSMNELNKKYGSWETFIKKRLEILKKEREKKQKEKKQIEIDYVSPLNLEGNINTFNFGYLLLQKVYYHLGIDQFFYHVKNNHNLKIKYSLNDVMKFLIYTRAIIPGSKLDNSKRTKYFAEEFDINIDDIYDALDYFYEYKDKLQEYVYNKAKFLLPPSNKAIFYDVTNFYYEIEEETELAAYGIEKNHRPDPITSFGLFMDSNGIPMRFASYRGNINEKKQVLPEWKELENNLKDNGYIVCSDAGLNCSNLKHYLLKNKNHYIFSQSVKQLNSSLKEELLDSNGYIAFNDTKKYKVKKMIKDSFVDSKFSTRKDGKTKVGIDTMYIFVFDEKRRKYMLDKIKEREEKAKEIIKNPSNFDKVSSSNGKQYINKIIYDETGEIQVEQSILTLNKKLIEDEKKYAGYGCIITDLFNEEVSCIIKIASSRWEIEDCFRQMKTGFSTRPIYLRTPNHIHAHFLTCYLALTISKLLERKYLKGITSEELFNILRNTNYIKLPTGDYMAGNVSSIAQKAFKKIDFKELLFTYISNNTLTKVITNSKQKYMEVIA